MALFSSRRRSAPRQSSYEDSKWQRIKLALTGAASGGWAAFFGNESKAGKLVTRETALQLSTAWACIRLNSEAVPIIPPLFYRKNDDGSRDQINEYETALLFHDSPNADQTPFEYLQGQSAWLAAQGNAYSLKHEGARGRVTALQPLCNDHVMPYRTVGGDLKYRVNDRGKIEELPREKIFHVRGFGFGGDLGLSPIRYGVQTLGSAMAAEESAAKIFANGLQASGVLSSDTTLAPEQRKDLQEIMEKFVGSDKAGKLMVLEAGLEFKQLSILPEDAQMLETRRFSVEEICRWFGVPPILVGHAAQGQTMWGTGVEQILLAWLVLGLNPLLKRIEQRINKDLIPQRDRMRVYAEFNREALLQMDSTTKANFLSTMVQNALMDRNEGRAKLNLPKRPGADVLTAQTNLAPLDQLGRAAGEPAQRLAQALRDLLGETDQRATNGDRP